MEWAPWWCLKVQCYIKIHMGQNYLRIGITYIFCHRFHFNICIYTVCIISATLYKYKHTLIFWIIDIIDNNMENWTSSKSKFNDKVSIHCHFETITRLFAAECLRAVFQASVGFGWALKNIIFSFSPPPGFSPHFVSWTISNNLLGVRLSLTFNSTYIL